LSEENVALVRAAVDDWPRGDFRAAAGLFSDGVEMSAYQPEGVLAFNGRPDVIRFMNEFGSDWESYRVDVEDVRALSDEVVLVSGRQIGKGRASGVEISEPLYVAILMRDGRIAAHHWHVERAAALARLGL
jgi:ketosteroid isomerase-like protein